MAERPTRAEEFPDLRGQSQAVLLLNRSTVNETDKGRRSADMKRTCQRIAEVKNEQFALDFVELSVLQLRPLAPRGGDEDESVFRKASVFRSAHSLVPLRHSAHADRIWRMPDCAESRELASVMHSRQLFGRPSVATHDARCWRVNQVERGMTPFNRRPDCS